MNDQELRARVHAAMHALIEKKGIASPVDVLMAIGCLSKEHYENWRFGRVACLERVCRINLSKLSMINHEIRVFAQQNNLKPSWTDYRKWGKGDRARLRFSKSGNARVEELYATHYVGQAKIEDANERREARKHTKTRTTATGDARSATGV